MSTAAPLKLTPPAQGAKITLRDGKLVVPDNPIIPFIEGDGTGPDIWRASVRVLDAAVQKAYGGRRKIHWMEVFAGEKVEPPVRQLAARRDRDRLPRVPGRDQGPAHHARSAAASARSTWRCASCSTSTSACARCAGSRACPRP